MENECSFFLLPAALDCAGTMNEHTSGSALLGCAVLPRGRRLAVRHAASESFNVMEDSGDISSLSRQWLRQRLQACSCQVMAALLLTLAALVTVVLSVSDLPERRSGVETSGLSAPPAQHAPR
jgi:hypothetical protein